MGFSQTDTTHHFLLTANGGIIQVIANDSANHGTVDAIRNHMEHIAGSFAAGDFSIPHFVHNQQVPGVKVMKKQKAEIKYTAEQIPAGERVVITTNSATALRAVHDFLRFQIKDHQTGDPTEEPKTN
jgi:TusA-related sulfurtransferase